MDNIFDGIQRPLQAIKEASNGSIYIPKGIRTEALDKTKLWAFEPSANVKVIFDLLYNCLSLTQRGSDSRSRFNRFWII